MSKLFYIVEGPAGCGKSTLIKRVAAEKLWTPVPFTPYPNRPRSYDGREGIELSLRKDLATSTDVALAPSRSVLVADRWQLSQWIYGSMRRSAGLDPDQGIELFREGLGTIVRIQREMACRGNEVQQKEEVLASLWIIIPQVTILNSNRSMSSKEYPFPAYREISFYERAAELLQAYLPVNVLRYHNAESRAQMFGKITKEIPSLTELLGEL